MFLLYPLGYVDQRFEDREHVVIDAHWSQFVLVGPKVQHRAKVDFGNGALLAVGAKEIVSVGVCGKLEPNFWIDAFARLKVPDQEVAVDAADAVERSCVTVSFRPNGRLDFKELWLPVIKELVVLGNPRLQVRVDVAEWFAAVEFFDQAVNVGTDSGRVPSRSLWCPLQHVDGSVTFSCNHQLSDAAQVVDGLFCDELLSPILKEWLGEIASDAGDARNFGVGFRVNVKARA